MAARTRGLVCIVAAAAALALIGGMVAQGRTKDPLLWLAVIALSIVAFALKGKGGWKTAGVSGTRRRVVKKRIVLDVNGERREYGSMDEVPAEYRERILEARRTGGGSSITVNINGEERTYGSLEEVPAEYRAVIEKMRAKRGG